MPPVFRRSIHLIFALILITSGSVCAEDASNEDLPKIKVMELSPEDLEKDDPTPTPTPSRKRQKKEIVPEKAETKIEPPDKLPPPKKKKPESKQARQEKEKEKDKVPPPGTKAPESKQATVLPFSRPPENAVVEIVPTRAYIEFGDLDQQPPGIIEWDKNSGKYLYISSKENPFIFFFGKIPEGYELAIDNRWVPVENGKFEFKVGLPLEPSFLSLKIFSPSRKVQLYRRIYSWRKFPPSLRYKVKDEESVIEKSWGYTGRYSRSGWVQLYSRETPIPVVDLDSEPNANLYFRILYPPEPEDFYDSWELTIRDAENKIVGHHKRLGAPPPFIEWREMAPEIFSAGSYTYELDLYGGGGMVFRGKPNRFETIEGSGLKNYHLAPKFQFEPKEELGFFSFSNKRGTAYTGIYIGADVPLVFSNRYVFKASAYISLHDLEDRNTISFMRVGGGLRYQGTGDSGILGHPFFYRIDILANFSNFTVHPRTGVNRYTQPSLLVEPHLIVWNYHYLVPWMEIGARPNLKEVRLSFGMNYYLYVRPWSVKMGIGFAYDKLLAHPTEDMKFTIFRTMAQALYLF